ncbi:MAG TPA: hypothetical protein PKV64_05685 [Candidatus Aminicenantes bacterium]|nr:hypothetical protein [Candidatus Aminicenantes bacterium]
MRHRPSHRIGGRIVERFEAVFLVEAEKLAPRDINGIPPAAAGQGFQDKGNLRFGQAPF